MTFIFKRDYFIFAFDCLYSFIAAGHLKGKELGQLFRFWFQPRCFIQCQQMCNQNHPPLSVNKEGKNSFWKWNSFLDWNYLNAWFHSIILQMMHILLLSPWSQFERLAPNLQGDLKQSGANHIWAFLWLVSPSLAATVDTFIKEASVSSCHEIWIRR